MKIICLSPLFKNATLGCMLAAISVDLAKADIILSNFDRTNGTYQVANWSKWYGRVTATMTFDSTKDARDKTDSGSMKVKLTSGANSTTQEFALRGALSGDGDYDSGTVTINATEYRQLEFDLFWDPDSTKQATGDFSGMQVRLIMADYTQSDLPEFPVPLTNGWQHVVIPMGAKMSPSPTKVTGVNFQMPALQGAAIFWLDNIELISSVASPIPPSSVK